MNKILVGISILLVVIYIISFHKKETNFLVENYSPEITVSKNNQQLELDLEEYIVGVVAGEMPALYQEEALKAQAIASRTYAYNYLDKTIKATKDNQVYLTIDEMKDKWQDDFDKYYLKIKNIVYETKGIIMTYQGEPIKAYYYSESNGYTETSQNVFNEQLDYYDIVKSPQDGIKITTIEISKEDFCSKLNLKNEDIKITDITYDESNRVSSITINNQLFKGTEIRKLLDLRSTDFQIDINDTVSIKTKGYGHGVGMSQHGANEMAKNGSTYEEILKHYYKNIEISTI